MDITLYFLEATDPAVPLTKTFIRHPDGRLEKKSYPQARRFTSHKRTVKNLEEALNVLVEAADKGWCLVKGKLLKTLRKESRKDSTITNGETWYLCIDIDGIPNMHTPEEFIKNCLPAEFHNVSYIWQPSASAGIVEGRGLSGHLFFLMPQPELAPRLKQWLIHQNLDNETLAGHIRLARNGYALIYALDISTCQEDKLIFIAPPTCRGFDDPLTERFKLVIKEDNEVRINFDGITKAINNNAVQKKLNELRERAGLTKRTFKYKTQGTEYVLTNPEESEVTGVEVGPDYTQLNLNGGDSWAYWHHNHDPVFLYNFKGEPTVRIKDALPDYWSDLMRQRQKDSEEIARIYREFESDTYYNLLYNKLKDRHVAIPVSSKEKLKDFMSLHGQAMPDPVPDWRMSFDPSSDIVIDFQEQYVNTYQKSDLMREAIRRGPVNIMPGLVQKILWSVCGSNKEAYDHFVNWLAYIYQYRRKAMTAWILHGTQGTGKGVLFNKIIAPTLGREYCPTKTMANLEDDFNNWMAQCILGLIDEMQISNAKNPDAMMNKLKNMITEDVGTLRAMHQNQKTVELFASFIIAGNMYDIMRIDRGDRRFNVAPRQETRLMLTSDDIDLILPGELLSFARYMMHYDVNVEMATRTLENDAKKEMMTNTTTSTDEFFEALRTGDLSYFLQFYHDKGVDQFAQGEYQRVVKTWAAHNHDGPKPVERSDAQIAYQFVLRDRGVPSAKFGRIMGHHGMAPKPLRIGGRQTRGILINWECDPDEARSILLDNVRNLESAK